jgi:hypothetical protein
MAPMTLPAKRIGGHGMWLGRSGVADGSAGIAIPMIV